MIRQNSSANEKQFGETPVLIVQYTKWRTDAEYVFFFFTCSFVRSLRNSSEPLRFHDGVSPVSRKVLVRLVQQRTDSDRFRTETNSRQLLAYTTVSTYTNRRATLFVNSHSPRSNLFDNYPLPITVIA